MFSTRTTKNMSTSTTFTGKRPSLATEGEGERTVRTFSDDPFRARFGHRLPRGLRQEARGMTWRNFSDTYSPTHGPVQIRNFTAERGTLGRIRFNADLTLTDRQGNSRTFTEEITAMGPVSACTNLLADAGYRVEIVEFHQFEIFEATATFVYAAHNHDHVWTMGFGQTPETSVLNAMVCAANRLHG
ncbi:hypothetical protein [Corynebacterium lactis]|uniref:Acetyl-CoA acetyltransferase n=1 Tax=Corynebacterium lactis RW2-5 TaxID=1408189 RepID=A0A0K2H240_9CORY|nr:hypothetical protein [Corynebacterium lactis]ALA68104.1 acetyl-CoA acetyltransferase [Corynebacterium lactis RW2-5]